MLISCHMSNCKWLLFPTLFNVMGSHEIYFHPSYTGIIQATTKNRNLHVFYILDVQYTAILSKQNSDELTNPSFYYNEDYANEFQCKRQSNTSKSKKH